MDLEDSSIDFDDIEDTSSSNNDAIEQPSAFTQLTDAKSNPLQTLFIEYTDDLPEYPRTHLNGYTYIVSVGGQLQDIQYSRSSIRSARTSVKSSFLNCSVKK